MKEIPLTKGFVTLVDDEDYEKLSARKWHVKNDGKKQYARTKINGTKVGMHRLIMGLINKDSRKWVVDHKDGNGLNNQKSNLRICTPSQNSMNIPKLKGNSQYKGVSFRKDIKKWRVLIEFEGRKIALGSFKDEVEAAIVYDAKAKELFGEFARTNF